MNAYLIEKGERGSKDIIKRLLYSYL